MNNIIARGAPTKYDERFVEQARIIMTNLGATMVDLAQIFAVTEGTLYQWIKLYPDLSKAIKEGREAFDTSMVEASLRHRAVGYSHPDTHVSNYKGEVTLTPIIKHYAPDPTSMIFWLKNRDPNRWRDKQEVEHSGNISITQEEQDL